MKLKYKNINWVLIFIGIEVLTGILMYYVNFPMGTQAIHFVIGILLFGVQFYMLLKSFQK